MRHLKHVFVCASLLSAALLQSPAFAQDEDFTNALLSAYKTNPRIKAERETLASLDEQYNQAFSGFRPTATANYDRGRQRNSFDNADWTYSKDEAKQLVIEQPLFNGGGTIARMNSSRKQVEAGRAQLKGVEQQVLFDAVQSYMDVVRGQSVLELSRNNTEVLRKQLKASQDRFDVGEVTKTDVAQSESRVARAESDEAQARGDLESAKATFARVVGIEPGNIAFPSTIAALPSTLEEAVSIALSNNPTIEVSKNRKLASDSDVSARQADILPSLSLRGTSSREEGAGVRGSNTFDKDSVVLAFRIPLYQAGAEYSRVREAKVVSQRRTFEAVDATDAVREGVTRAWEALQTSKSTIVSNEAAIKAAEIALDGVKQEQQFGARTTLDVLDAEQELFVARVNLVRSQRNLMVSVYNLLANMGKLTMQDLALNTPTYDAKAHYDDVKYKMFGF